VNVARVDRMKEAKTEAEQIIAAYRAEMEAAYKSKAASVTIISLRLRCFCIQSHFHSHSFLLHHFLVLLVFILH
jgi:hypothetical protein